MAYSLEQKRERNRRAQKKFYKTPKGRKYVLEKTRKWMEKKRKEDPNYFKRYNKDRASYYKSYHAKRKKGNPEKFKQLNREAQRRYYKTEKGKKAIKERIKRWTKKKRVEDPNYFKKYEQDSLKRVLKWRKNNPRRAKEINRKGAQRFYKKTKKIPKYILLRSLRSRLGFIFNSIKNQQKTSTKRLLGCSLEELIIFIEKKFKKDMSWDNYGKWHVDHIKPISKFDLTDKEEQKKCFHYSNLQPLWAIENLKKGSKIQK